MLFLNFSYLLQLGYARSRNALTITLTENSDRCRSKKRRWQDVSGVRQPDQMTAHFQDKNGCGQYEANSEAADPVRQFRARSSTE